MIAFRFNIILHDVTNNNIAYHKIHIIFADTQSILNAKMMRMAI